MILAWMALVRKHGKNNRPIANELGCALRQVESMRNRVLNSPIYKRHKYGMNDDFLKILRYGNDSQPSEQQNWSKQELDLLVESLKRHHKNYDLIEKAFNGSKDRA